MRYCPYLMLLVISLSALYLALLHFGSIRIRVLPDLLGFLLFAARTLSIFYTVVYVLSVVTIAVITEVCVGFVSHLVSSRGR